MKNKENNAISEKTKTLVAFLYVLCYYIYC